MHPMAERARSWFSPRTTLQTFGPGPRALVAEAERRGELAIHVVRAGLWLVLVAGTTIGARFGVPIAIGLAAIAGLWYLGWRVLSAGRPRRWLSYALIVLDAFVIVRPALLNGSIGEALTPLGFAMSFADLTAIVAPLLVFLALSGALRIDPRTAIFATFVSLGAYAFFALRLHVPMTQAVLTAVVVAFSGAVGANASRVVRYLVLKTSEEVVLERYVPMSLTRELARSGMTERAGGVRDVTVLLCDIRGFTRLSESMTPAATVAFLDGYFGAVCEPLVARGAVIDKFLGDGVLAFFEDQGHASAAVQASREILAVLDAFNAERATPIRIGIALHTGPVLIGTIGGGSRREYTLISDTVNVVSRLEELNKTYGSTIVASAETIMSAGSEATGFSGPIEVAIRGRDEPVSIHLLRV